MTVLALKIGRLRVVLAVISTATLNVQSWTRWRRLLRRREVSSRNSWIFSRPLAS